MSCSRDAKPQDGPLPCRAFIIFATLVGIGWVLLFWRKPVRINTIGINPRPSVQKRRGCGPVVDVQPQPAAAAGSRLFYFHSHLYFPSGSWPRFVALWRDRGSLAVPQALFLGRKIKHEVPWLRPWPNLGRTAHTWPLSRTAQLHRTSTHGAAASACPG